MGTGDGHTVGSGGGGGVPSSPHTAPVTKSLRSFWEQEEEKLIWQSLFYFSWWISRPVASPACCRHVHALQLVVLLPLHPAVLKPDFDLSLWEAEGMGDLDPPPAGQVPVEVELLLQLQGLVPGVRSPGPLPLWSGQILYRNRRCRC